jgi:biuret amidohydrolase
MPIVDAQPYPYEFARDHVALMAIDMQRDYLEPGGYGASLGINVAPCAAIVPTMQRLLAGFRAAGCPVIHTRQCHKPDLSDCPPAKRRRGRHALRIGDPGPLGRLLICGEPGSDIVPELAPLPGETVIDKPGKGSFYNTDLSAILEAQAITHLVLAGVTTEVCVQSTIREANDRGFDCLIVEDATASYYPAFKQATLEMVRSSDALIGWTATTDQLLHALAA